MEKDDKRLFYDEYEDGERDYYVITWEELIECYGEEKARKIWDYGIDCNDEKPTSIKDWDNFLSYDELISSYLFDD